MSSRAELFLGIIALASLATALVQIAVLVAAALLARRLTRLTDRLDEQMRPVFAHLDAIGKEAVRASSVAAAQVDRVDGLFADVVDRVETSMDAVQSALAVPAREGAALMAGVRAAFSALRDLKRPRPRGRGEDEDALFI